MSTVFLWLIYGVAGMFFSLASIAALGAIIYPLYLIWEGFKNKLL